MAAKKHTEYTFNVENVENKFLKVTPREGYKLTNGETISETLYTPLKADLSVWKEITDAEAVELQAALDAKAEAGLDAEVTEA